MAVQILGYCKAPAIWAGVGMTCAFLWGTYVRTSHNVLSHF